MPVKTRARAPSALVASDSRSGSCSARPSAARRIASGWPEISWMNGSGKFPNDFIARSVRCRAYGCEGRGGRGRQHLHPGARRGVRHPRRPAPRRRARAPGHRSGAPRGRRRAGGAHAAPRRMVRVARPHRRPAPGARGRGLRDRAAAGRRPGGEAPGRDDPPGVRVHRAGDDRARRVREGAAHRAGRAGSRGGDRRAWGAGRVVRGLHESDGARHAGAARPRSPGARALQRRDRLPAAVRRASSAWSPSGCSSSTWA